MHKWGLELGREFRTKLARWKSGASVARELAVSMARFRQRGNDNTWICLNLVLLASNGFVTLQTDHLKKILSHKCNHSQWVCMCAENCLVVFRKQSHENLDRQTVKTIKIIRFLNQLGYCRSCGGWVAIGAVNVVTNRFRVYGIEMSVTHGRRVQ